MTQTSVTVETTAPETAAPQPKSWKRSNKVSIVGFAPSSMRLAPFDDLSVEIWTLNNIYTAFEIPRYDRWFELHQNFRSYPPMHDSRVSAESVVMGDARPVIKSMSHVEWLQQQSPERPIYFVEAQPDIPAAVPYPLEEIKAWCHRFKFKPYFTNSISYMIALAIAERYEQISIYGVDMAAAGEYQLERPSVEYWIGLAQGLGIEVILPDQCELLKARFYGFDRDSDFVLKARTRMNELLNNHNQAIAQRDQANLAASYFKGAADDSQYYINNWGNGG